jgi:hypothetical protein
MIYRGEGGSFAPYAPKLDALIGRRMLARGLVGTRDSSRSVFGSTWKEQALAFARDENEDSLFVLEPLRGAVVSFIPGGKDMQMLFSDHLRMKCDYERDFHYRGYSFERLANDVRGDIDLMEEYLHQGRQKRAISAMIDRYLDTVTFEEHMIDDPDEGLEFLSGHEGEVWITGPLRKRPYDHTLDPEVLAMTP